MPDVFGNPCAASTGLLGPLPVIGPNEVLPRFADTCRNVRANRSDYSGSDWEYYLYACGYLPPAPRARAYIELFDGLQVDDRITDLRLNVEVGGYEAYDQPAAYSLRVLGRSRLNGADLVTLAEEPISMPTAPVFHEPDSCWRPVTIDLEEIDAHAVRCIVCLLIGSHSEIVNTTYRRSGADQTDQADAPPWGFRIVSYNLWASSLRRNVTPESVVEDIVSPYWSGEHFFCPDESGVECDQVVFDQLPRTRVQALQDVDAMLDWDYEATETDFTYRKPTAVADARDDELYTVSLADPHYEGTITPAMDECCNGARIDYTSRGGKLTELVRHWESETLGDVPKTRFFSMPEAIRSHKQALKMMERIEASYAEPPIAGTAGFQGKAPVASGELRDCLLMKPGELLQVQDAPRTFRRTERNISAVALHPLSRSCEVELGAKSRRLEKVLARMATQRPLT